MEVKAMESQPMKPDELGKYVCVAHGGGAGGCLHSPHITISSDGVWVRLPDSLNPGSHVYSSAHRDCFERWNARERLEALRATLRAENISYSELAELQSLAPYIEPGDAELLEAAGVPEHSAAETGRVTYRDKPASSHDHDVVPGFSPVTWGDLRENGN